MWKKDIGKKVKYETCITQKVTNMEYGGWVSKFAIVPLILFVL